MLFKNIESVKEFAVCFVFHLLKLLATLGNEFITVIPLFSYWIKKHIPTSSMSNELKMEMEVLDSLLNTSESHFSDSRLRRILKMPFLSVIRPFQSEAEFDQSREIYEMLKEMNKMTRQGTDRK